MDTEILTLSAKIIFIFMNVMFLIAQLKKDNSIVDIGWGIGFILVTMVLVLSSGMASPVHLAFFAMVLIWGWRLAEYIYKRNRGSGEDFRYAAWRKEWGKNVVWRAYLQVFVLQGIIMWIVLSPAYAMFNNPSEEFGSKHLIGILLWGIGFYFEAVGDNQMQRFRADKANKRTVMDQGLWKLTRHPNYFGEALLWWGLGIFAFNPDLWWLSFIGPAVITFLLLKVSGVAMLERKYDGNSKYAQYKRTTSAFIPWFPKKQA